MYILPRSVKGIYFIDSFGDLLFTFKFQLVFFVSQGGVILYQPTSEFLPMIDKVWRNSILCCFIFIIETILLGLDSPTKSELLEKLRHAMLFIKYMRIQQVLSFNQTEYEFRTALCVVLNNYVVIDVVSTHIHAWIRDF